MFPVTAVGAALAASVTDGATAVLEQRSTKQVPARRNALSVLLIFDLLHRPMWLIAISLNLLGVAFQIVALHFGALALARAGPRPLRPLMLALGCGICYGVMAFLFKLLSAGSAGGFTGLLRQWPLWAVVVVGPLGFLLNESALQAGILIAPVLSVITAADPLVSIGIAHQWLHESIADGPLNVTMEATSLALMIAGIVVLAHRAPQVAQQLETSQDAA